MLLQFFFYFLIFQDPIRLLFQEDVTGLNFVHILLDFGMVQGIFGQQLERYPNLDDVITEISLKCEMWEARRDMTTVTEQWKDALIKDVPVKEWQDQCQLWWKVATRADRELPVNNVVPRLKEMAVLWKDLVPICSDLKNPALQVQK